MCKFIIFIFACGLWAGCTQKDNKSTGEEKVVLQDSHQLQNPPMTVDSTTTFTAVDSKVRIDEKKLEIIQKLSDDFSGSRAMLDLGNNEYMVVPVEAYAESMAEDKFMRDNGISCPSVNKSKQCKSDIFQGCIRGKIKTTMLTGTATPFNTVRQLLTTLPKDETMKALKLEWFEDAERSKPERQNVWIKKAYLHMIYREPDNDFHLIIGDKPNVEESVLMNVEVSGIPRGASEETTRRFMKVRNQIINHSRMGDIKCGRVLGPLQPAIPISKLVGSLFFDDPHDEDVIGRNGVKVFRAWEIHPVKEIVFGDF